MNEVDKPSTISLPAQAAAVRRAAINHRGHVNNLRDLVTRGKRPRHEFDIAAEWLPALLAAADTMEAIAANSKQQLDELHCERAGKARGAQSAAERHTGTLKT
jgi:hypothetical protein